MPATATKTIRSRRRGWTPEEDAVIRSHYKTRVPNSSAFTVTGRAYSSTQKRAIKLGVLVPNDVTRGWKTSEEKLLAQEYPKHGVKGCLHLFPGRSYAALASRAAELGLKMVHFRTARLDAGKAHAVNVAVSEAGAKRGYLDTQEINALARDLDVAPRSVRHRAKKLGLLVASVRRGWSRREDDILRAHDRDVAASIEALREIGSVRNANSVYTRCYKLGIVKGFDDKHTQADLVEMLGVSTRTVEHWVTKGWLVSEGHGNRAWTSKEIKLLLVKHPNAWDITKVNQNFILGVLTGSI